MSLRWVVWALFVAPVAVALHLALPLRAVPEATTPSAQRPRVVQFILHNTLQPVSAKALQDDLDEANRQQPEAILLNLSSPGGLPESAAAMVRSIQNSAAPVLVYVREPHTRVAGEALLLLNAGAVSAMHPEAVLGMSRRSETWRWHSTEAEDPAPINAQLQAQLRQKSGQQSDRPHYFIGDETLSAQSALQAGLIDTIANTNDRFISSLDGRQITVRGQVVRLDLRNFVLQPMPLSQREHLMRALMNPDLTVLLLTLGALLVYLEINTPGGIVPGAAGLLLVLLALYAFHEMPVRWEGCALLLVSVALLFAEAHLERGRVLAVGSVLCLVLGLRLLVRGPIPELVVDWSTALGAGIGFGGITAGLLLLGVRAKRAKVKTGAEAMVGWLGIAQTPLSPGGQVLVRGELWNATLSSEKSFLPAGECVTVQQFQGTTLEVAPLPSPGQAG